ncbi:MAG: cyclic peptide export ABC transporter [Mojavia pulchra JT2-VF2]|jgi:putative ATP-binding cassette transporter|uniref:Cyclic peptide export ABC transporter n=1 Tax=Mojavia pulchra JT2-VF2 TaxID=287848 RepID=A0A951UJQ4_9NOST|nr:cyclic peptide export ABC transporter [Mojavia pulchra JT2-VF2]
MNLFWLVLRASRLQIAIAILTGLVSGGSTARLIGLINSAISGNFTDNLVWYFGALALVVLFNSLICQFLLINISEDAVYRLRLRLSEGILSSPLINLEQLGPNRLMATLTEDITTLSNTVYAIPFICVDIAIIGGCLIYLYWLSGIVFAVTVGFIMVAVGSIQLLINNAQHFLNLARNEQDRLFQHFRTLTDGIKELKLHATRRQEFFSEELQTSAAISRKHNVAALLSFSIGQGWSNLLFFILVGLLLFALPNYIAIERSILSAYVLTLTYLLLPMQSILDKLQQLSKASVTLQKIERIGLKLTAETETNSAIKLPLTQNWTKLELQQVTHAYPDEQEDNHFVLGPIDLTIYPSELIFIVGGNGSGKSTLAKVITGLYIPNSGQIKLDDQVIDHRNREWYRQQFSVVFADSYLFERLLDTGNADLDIQVRQYLRLLNLDSKVKIVKGQLTTTALSQGQQKRLVLLTAYLENRPICLFDEWASEQDPNFREFFYKQILLNLKQQGKTVFVISHDAHYFPLADRIIKLDYGKVEYDSYNPL